MSMRLLLVSSEFPPGPGGIGTHAFQLARHLHEQGIEVVVLTGQDYRERSEIEPFNGSLPFVVIGFERGERAIGKLFVRLRQVQREIREFRPDVVLASGSRPVWLCALASIGAARPWFAVGHGTEFGFRRSLDRLLNRWAYGRATAVICVSAFTERVLRRSGIRPRATRVVHNGADERGFAPLPELEVRAFKHSLGLEDRRVLLTVGNLSRRKGQDLVIHALPEILRAVPDAHYLLVGVPSLRSELEDLARRLGVADRVSFAGVVPKSHLAFYYNLAELFVMTSRMTSDGDFEGFGIAVLEAALCAKAAVVARDSGLAEAIEDGLTGLSVRAEDCGDIAAKVCSLLLDDEKRRAMGEAARVRVLRQGGWAGTAAAYRALFEWEARARQR